MPKIKKEPLTDDESFIDVVSCPTKKHKSKKHKRKRNEDMESSCIDSPSSSGLKLKIKIGGQTLAETRVIKTEITEESSNESANMVTEMGGVPDTDEEAWLEALEAGRLDEVDDELKRMRDPALMTARQRSLLSRKKQREVEVETPVVMETIVLSEEMIQKKIIKAKKRKEQAAEKLKKDKKQTLDRLLKKCDTRHRLVKKTDKKADVPRMKYVNSLLNGRSISLPVGFQFPLKTQLPIQPPVPILCGVDGCQNRKKYSCSMTGVPLCSLNCYKKNLFSDMKPKIVSAVT